MSMWTAQTAPLPPRRDSVRSYRGEGDVADGSTPRCPGGGSRLRGLASKLRHPLVDVRTRAISNLSGKISLGLVDLGDLESEPSFFPDIVALLQELVLPEVVPDSGNSLGHHEHSTEVLSISGPLLSLCGQLAKNPSARAMLIGHGAAEPLSRIANNRHYGDVSPDLTASVSEVLASLDASPDYHSGNASSDAATCGENAAGGIQSTAEKPRIASVGPADADACGRSATGPTTTAARKRLENENMEGGAQARALFGDASPPRGWPRWTRDLVDGSSLSSRVSSAGTLARCLKGGWRFPAVRLVRSEESALFDFEVRFKTANSEAILLSCIRHLRDNVLEDYPAEVILQRLGTLGRLTSLLRAPSASEKILEEALSTAHRLFERLVTSARVYLDPAFLPPSVDSADATRGDDSGPRGPQRVSEGEAAAATLLSFRYPQPASSTPAPYNDYDDGDDGGGEYDSVSSGEGLSVCGALFAILLSVCPLLGYREGCGLQGVGGDGARGYAEGGTRADPQTLSGAVLGGSVSVSKVAVAAGELLQALIPYLLEPVYVSAESMASPPAAAEAAAAASAGCGWGRTEGTPGLSSPLDSLRFQELASSMGRVLADSGLIDHHTHNTDRCAGEEGAAMAATGAPYPLVSSVLTMLLQLQPSDIGHYDEEDNHSQDERGRELLIVQAPAELASAVRGLVWSPDVDEQAPWVRRRLRPYLRTLDAVGESLLQDAQALAAEAVSALDVEGGPEDTWDWVVHHLEQVERGLPLLQAVGERRMVAAVVALFASAAAAAGTASRASGDDQGNRATAGTAVRVGAKLLRAFIDGSYGEQACCQALETLEDILGLEPPAARIRVPIAAGLVDSLIQRGLPDLRQPLPGPAASCVALALITWTSGDDDNGDRWCLFSSLMRRATTITNTTVPADTTCTTAIAMTTNQGRQGHTHNQQSRKQQQQQQQPLRQSFTRAPAITATSLICRSCSALHDLLRSAPIPRRSTAELQGTRTGSRESRAGAGILRNGSRGNGAGSIRHQQERGQPGSDVESACATGGAAAGNLSVPPSSDDLVTVARALAPALEAFSVLLLSDTTSPVDMGRGGGEDEGDGARAGSDVLRLQRCRTSVAALVDYLDALPRDISINSCTAGAAGPNGKSRILTDGSPDGRVESDKAFAGVGGDGDDGMSRLWVEVRLMCRANAQDREGAARRLWEQVVVKTEQQNTHDILRSNPSLHYPTPAAGFSGSSGFLFTPDPIAFSIPGSAERSDATKKVSSASSWSSSTSLPAFSPEHVRNLADAAGSPTLEVGLRTAAAEQLRGVLVAPGVARAILQNDLDAEGGDPDGNRNKTKGSSFGDEGMSSLSSRVLRAACSFLLPKSALPTPWTSSAGTANNKNSEEVFLGLLWTAVWKFPPVRLTLAKGGGSGNRIDSEEITGEMVATAVLRRLFDTRPAVRRLASRIAVRVAFDAPTFFSVFAPSPSPLSSVAVRYGTPPSTCPTSPADKSTHSDFDDNFYVSPILYRAYPKLHNWNDCRQATSTSPTRYDDESWVYDRVGDDVTPRNHERRVLEGSDYSLVGPLMIVGESGCGQGCRGAGTELCAAIAVPKQTENTDRYDVVLRLAAGEWKKKKAASRAGEGVLRAEDVADCVSRELMGASRRSEFGSAMRKARAWMLAGPAYLKAFFGKSEAWQNAFRRFLETPPKSVNDRIVLREVMELLRTGVRYMCPRGLMILADATEVCLTPTLSDTWIPSDGGAGEVFGDWRPATFRKDSPRELEVKEALRLSVLELLVAVVASSSPPPPSSAASPCTDLHRKTTTALARSSLVPVLCDEFMAGENEFGGAPRRSDDGIGGNGERSPRARRLAIEFVAGLVRRCGPEVTRIWSGVSQQGPAVGKQARENRRTLTMGEGLEFDEQTGEARFWTSSVLAHMIQALARTASVHRAPDGFRGRSVLTVSLVGLQAILHSACTILPWKHEAQHRRHVSGLLNLVCHRDAAVRALALSAVTEFQCIAATNATAATSAVAVADVSPEAKMPEHDVGGGADGGSGGADDALGGEASLRRHELEIVETFVRAAGDEFHECAAVRVEALRFLCRHVAHYCDVADEREGKERVTPAANVPEYALPLAVSLARAVPSLLSPPGRSGEGAAGYLSVATGSLRFVAVVVTATCGKLDNELRWGGGLEPPSGSKGGDESSAVKGLPVLLKDLWESGCPQACVHLLGETPSTRPRHHLNEEEFENFTGGWPPLLHVSSITRETSALRRAQATALNFLKSIVCSPASPLLRTSSTIPVSAEEYSTKPTAAATPTATKAAAAARDLRWSVIKRTPLLPGVVRCLIGVVDDVTSPVSSSTSSSPATSNASPPMYTRVEDDHAYVAREACILLACLLSSATDEGDDMLAPGGSAVIPVAVFDALAGVLRWSTGDFSSGQDSEEEAGTMVSQAREAAKRVLLAMLSLPRWKNSLHLRSTEAFWITMVLLREETRALAARPSHTLPQRREGRGSDGLRTHCLLQLLECGEGLRELAVSEGLLGEAFVFLETLLGQMATKGHGVDTLKTASKQLEILKKTSRKVKHRGVVERSRVADGGGKARDTSRASSLSSSPPPASAVGTPRIGRDGATASSRARQRRPLRRASPPLTGNDPGTTLDHDHDGNDDNDEEKGNGQRRGRGGNQGRRAAISVTGQVAQGDGAADENTVHGEQQADRAAILEREFSRAATLMVAGMSDCRKAQAECLRLGIPQMLWKAWPLALASELSSSFPNQGPRGNHRNDGVASPGDGVRVGGRGSVLLQAVLGLACAVARGFPEGKKAFVFAGPDGAAQRPAGRSGAGESGSGEWPRSSRSLLHRVASLALSSSVNSPDGSSPEYGVARVDRAYSVSASQAACDVVRSCCLAPECRVVLTQSGFFADLVGQIRHLYGRWGAKKGTSLFSRAVRRVGDLTGILVNATLTPEGQKTLLQVDSIGNMLGDLVDMCLRATSGAQAHQMHGHNIDILSNLDRLNPSDRNRDDRTQSSPSLGSPPPPRGNGRTFAITSPRVPLVARTLLLFRNLALAPSTGQVAAHRDALLDLILLVLERQGWGNGLQGNDSLPTDTLNTDIASFAASSCLRAVVRGGSADGGRKTCVGTGAARLTEVKQVVNSCLGVLERAAVGLGQVGVGGRSGGGDDIESETRARARVRFEGELLAVNDLL